MIIAAIIKLEAIKQIDNLKAKQQLIFLGFRAQAENSDKLMDGGWGYACDRCGQDWVL